MDDKERIFTVKRTIRIQAEKPSESSSTTKQGFSSGDVLNFVGLLILGVLVIVGIMLAMFFFAGVGNASTFRQYPLIFAANPRRESSCSSRSWASPSSTRNRSRCQSRRRAMR